jgi:hypothetical protein
MLDMRGTSDFMVESQHLIISIFILFLLRSPTTPEHHPSFDVEGTPPL